MATEPTVRSETLPNGLTLLAEPMSWVESAAFALLLPAGCAHDPEGKAGLANLVSDMVQRGAGPRDSRQLLNALEFLGVDYSASASVSHVSFSGATLADQLPPALEIFADIVQRPALPEDQLEDSRQVCLQEVRALEDDLANRMMLELRNAHFSSPLGRSHFGDEASIQGIAAADVAAHVARHFTPQGAILAVAGKFQWEALRALVAEQFGDWKGVLATAPPRRRPRGGYLHIECPSSQTQVGVAYSSAPPKDADYYRAWSGVNVLGDGMSSRLFTSVREEKGLCYAVDASYYPVEDEASVLCYAGTTSDRAQETLDVMLAELRQLRLGIRQDELDRLKVRSKSRLIMQQESSLSRANSIAGQWHFRREVRTLDEVSRIIDELTCDSINEYLHQHPPGNFTIATLGAEKLETSLEVS